MITVPFVPEISLFEANKTPLGMALTVKDGTVIAFIGAALSYCAGLTSSQREKNHWVIAIKLLNTALREPTYLKAATLSFQTACLLERHLATRIR